MSFFFLTNTYQIIAEKEDIDDEDYLLVYEFDCDELEEKELCNVLQIAVDSVLIKMHGKLNIITTKLDIN